MRCACIYLFFTHTHIKRSHVTWMPNQTISHLLSLCLLSSSLSSGVIVVVDAVWERSFASIQSTEYPRNTEFAYSHEQTYDNVNPAYTPHTITDTHTKFIQHSLIASCIRDFCSSYASAHFHTGQHDRTHARTFALHARI